MKLGVCLVVGLKAAEQNKKKGDRSSARGRTTNAPLLGLSLSFRLLLSLTRRPSTSSLPLLPLPFIVSTSLDVETTRKHHRSTSYVDPTVEFYLEGLRCLFVPRFSSKNANSTSSDVNRQDPLTRQRQEFLSPHSVARSLNP